MWLQAVSAAYTRLQRERDLRLLEIMHASSPKDLQATIAAELAAGRPSAGPSPYEKIAMIAAAQAAERALNQ